MTMSDDKVSEGIDAFCPELNIYKRLVATKYRWFWEFQGTKSDELHLIGLHSVEFAEAGFVSSVEALSHFTGYLVDIHNDTLKAVNDLDCSVSFASPVVQIDNSVVEAIADLQLTAKGKRKVV